LSAKHPYTSTGRPEFERELGSLRERDRLIGALAEAQSLNTRNEVLTAELLACRQEREVVIADIKASWSWRIGRLIMSPALMVRRILRSSGGSD
jgi:hypothetical protein